jgi:uroporphyrinogen-III synthase
MQFMVDKTIVVTRPKGDEGALTDALHASGYRVIHEPLLEIFLRHTERQALGRILMQEPDAVIVTSRHGVEALSLLTDMRDMFLLCVGEATEFAAQSHGFTRTQAGGGNADALLSCIAEAYDEGSRFLYACGAHVRTDIDALLTAQGMQVERLVLYDALASEELSETLTEQLKRGQIDAITFLSPRTGQIFAGLAAAAGVAETCRSVQAFCLSGAVVEPIIELPWQAVHSTDEATLASLVECIDNVFAR